MHILLIHQSFASMNEPGGTRHYELASRLVELGDKFTVVTGGHSYMTGEGRSISEPKEHYVDTLRVRYSWDRKLFPKFWLGRLISYSAFMVSSFANALFTRNVDVIWGTTPPMPQALTAYLISFLRRKPFVLEVRDLWPDFPIQLGIIKNRVLIWLSRRLERFLYTKADRLIVNSPGFIPHVLEVGVDSEKIVLIPNGTEVDMFDPSNSGEAVRAELGLEGKFIAVYAGALGYANDVEVIVSAAGLLNDLDDVVFVVIGSGGSRESLLNEIKKQGLKNIIIIPPQPKSMIPSFLAAADVCIATLKPIPLFDTTYPNKVFDYMAAGKPVALAIDGVIREVIEKAGAGIFVKPGDAKGMAYAVQTYRENRELLELHGRNGRTYVIRHFDRKLEAPKLQALFRTMRNTEP